METKRRHLFVTGKLASRSLRDTLKKMSPDVECEILVLPISVAALMTTEFVARHVKNSRGCERVMIPGLCKGSLSPIIDSVGVEVVRGPKDLKEIPEYLGARRMLTGYGSYHTKIVAEIVNAYELSLEQILERASYYRDSGADVIDLGCPVHGKFSQIGRVVKAIKKRGIAVSVDSFNPSDIQEADAAGVDYVLSINSQNIEIARGLRCKVVVIPDSGKGMRSLERNIERLESWRVRYIIDPVLNPIGFGFARSIGNYIAMRRRHPKAEMLLGLGNLTELTDADTTGVTAAVAGIVSELGIDYVLTTEVVSWAKGAVREMDIARRLMHYSCRNAVVPKHLTDLLITVKDPPFECFSEKELRSMQEQVRDGNFRIFADRTSIYVFNNRVFIKGTDIQHIFSLLKIDDASQAFYIGKELEKARLAVQLGKKYVQEAPLRWGYLGI